MGIFNPVVLITSIFVLLNPVSAKVVTPSSEPDDADLVLSKMILEREVRKLRKEIELDRALGNITTSVAAIKIENLKLSKAQILSMIDGEFTDFELHPITRILVTPFETEQTRPSIQAVSLRKKIQGAFHGVKCIVDPGDTDIPWLGEKASKYAIRREIVQSFAENPWTKYVAAVSDNKIFDRSIAGTAIYLGKSYFVTAWHVLSEIKGFRTKELFIGTAEREENSMSPKSVFKIDAGTIREDPNHDVVIFRVHDAESGISPRKAFEEAPICEDGPVLVQTRLRAAGFPRGNIFVCSTVNCFVTKYQDSWTLDEPNDPCGQIRAIGHTWKGYSGGPMIDMDRDCVVGIILNQTGPDYVNYSEPRVPATFGNAFGGVHIRYAIQFRDQVIAEITKNF